MAGTELERLVATDLDKMKGIYSPIKAGLAERFWVRKAPVSKLYPNEDDEFTFPKIGPSFRIISEYETSIRHAVQTGQPAFDEPILVQKLRPDGYLILNGHHRWAAAMRVGEKKVPIKIVNLALESDVKKILESTQHKKRATFNLDEVVYRTDDDPYIEKKLMFPFRLKFKQRMKLGIPALFYYLSKNGYDIWVYSANFYSVDDTKRFFVYSHVHVDGIITGTAKRKSNTVESAVSREKMISAKYDTTIHIDNNMILCTHGVSGEFEEYELSTSEEEWSKNVIDKIKEIEKGFNQ